MLEDLRVCRGAFPENVARCCTRRILGDLFLLLVASSRRPFIENGLHALRELGKLVC